MGLKSISKSTLNIDKNRKNSFKKLKIISESKMFVSDIKNTYWLSKMFMIFNVYVVIEKNVISIVYIK